MSDALWSPFNPAVAQWFRSSFSSATSPQRRGWPPIARGESTLILAPTGSGKTLAAFLWSLNRLMFEPPPEAKGRCRVLYVSPLKALAVDVERNLRAPLAGISNAAVALGLAFHAPSIAIRTGGTPAAERARFQREGVPYGPVAPSIWSSIHPKLLELIRSHRSTLLFVNSRRLTERLAGAINELAGELLVRAHHGS